MNEQQPEAAPAASSTAAAAGQRHHQRQSPHRWAWFVVAFAVFSVAWGGNEFTPMMVFYRGEDVFSPVFVDSLLASYAVGIAVSLLIAGPLSDRFGRRVVMLPAPIIALVGSLLIALGETTEALIFSGRVISGISIGVAMTAGGSWIKELSSPAFDPQVKPNAGAKRASMSLTGGFALGAALAGTLAQWAPFPGQLPYAVHMLLSVIAVLGISRVPETRQNAHLKVKRSFWSDMFAPSALHPRFVLAVVPVAPWVFGCAGVAYAIMPSLGQSGFSTPVALTALITAVAALCGLGIQQFGHLYLRSNAATGQQLGLVLAIVGMSLAAWTATNPTLTRILVTGVVLGCGYGVCLIAGLTEVQALASSGELGSLTAIFYIFTYIGFFFPMILTRASEWFTYPVMLGAGVVIAALELVLITAVSRKFLPPSRR